ncbi:MAG: hypothetical protein AABW88_00845 [Nanoarchaeota archaeon]
MTHYFDPFGASNYNEFEKLATYERRRSDVKAMREAVKLVIQESKERFEALHNTQGLTRRLREI